MADWITVKVLCDALIRRFGIPCTISWRGLERKVKDLFELQDCVMKYEDDEKEWITLGSQAELEEALLICQRSHSQILRLVITKENMVRIPVTDAKAEVKCQEDMMVRPLGQHLQAANISQMAVDQPVKPSKASSIHSSDTSGDLSYTPTDHTGTSAEKVEKVQKKKKSNKPKKRDCYRDLAMAIGPELMELKVETRESEPVSKETKEPVDCVDNEVINVRDNPEFSARKLGPLQENQLPKCCDTQSINLDAALVDTQAFGYNKKQDGIGISGDASAVCTQCGVDTTVQEVPEEKVKKPVKVSKNKRKGCYVELAEDVGPMLKELTIEKKGDQDSAAQQICTTTEVSAPVLQEAATKQQASPVTTEQQAAAVTTEQQAAAVTTKERTKPERVSFKGYRRASRRLPPNLGEVSADELDALRTKLQNTLQVLTRDEFDVIDSQGLAAMSAHPENDQMDLQLLQMPQGSCLSGEKRIKADTGDGAVTKKQKSKKRKGPKKPSCYVQLAADIGSELANLQVKVRSDDIQKVKGDEVVNDSEPSEPFIVVTNEGELNEEMIPGSFDASKEKDQPVNSVEACGTFTDCTTNTLNHPAKVTARPDGIVEECNTSSSVHDGEFKEQENNALSVEANVNHSMRSTVVAEAFGDVLTTYWPSLSQRVVQKLHTNFQPLSDGQPSQCNNIPADPVVHSGIICYGCDEVITGVRYKCGNCADFDLCEECEGKQGIHDECHVFVKLRYPVCGVGRKNGKMVPLLKYCLYDGEGENVEKGKCDVKHRVKDLRRLARDKIRDENQKEKELRREKLEEKLKRRKEKKASEERLKSRLKAKFIADASIPDGTKLNPDEKFSKSWVVKNNGQLKWSSKTKIYCFDGNIPVSSGSSQIDVPFLKPGQKSDITVDFVAPSMPGTYESKWQLMHRGTVFGPILWCQIKVPGNIDEQGISTKQEENSYKSSDNTTLTDSSLEEAEPSPVSKLVQDIVQPDCVQDANDSGSDEYLSSEDVPSEVISNENLPLIEMMASQVTEQDGEGNATSCVSVTGQELEWDIGCVVDNVIFPEDSCECVLDNEDRQSISSDSSDDFIVVPMPPCFDPDLPLSAEPRNIGFNKHDFLPLSDNLPSAFSPAVELSVYTTSDRSDSTTSHSPSIASGIESFTSGPTSGRTSTGSSSSSEGESLASLSTDTPLPVPVNLQVQVSSVPLIPVRVPSPISTGGAPQVENAVSLNLPVSTVVSVTTMSNTSEHSAGGAASNSIELPPSVNTSIPVATQPEPSVLQQPSISNNVLISTQPETSGSHQSTVTAVAPIATQPEPSCLQQPSVSTNDPIAIQSEPSNPHADEEIKPATQPRVVTSSVTSSRNTDFVSEVVSGALATAQTAIGAAASAGRTAYSTLGNLFILENDQPPTTAYYQIGEQEGDVTLTARGSAVRDQSAPLVTSQPSEQLRSSMGQLLEMGFFDRKLNETLLKKYNNNMASVVDELLHVTGNDWQQDRH